MRNPHAVIYDFYDSISNLKYEYMQNSERWSSARTKIMNGLAYQEKNPKINV